MLYLYRISIWLYTFIIFLMAPFHERAGKFRAGRKGLWQQLGQIKRDQRKLIWMHVASLGEFEQGRPLLEALRSEYPQGVLLLTFFSPSGYEVRRNFPLADYIFYLPLDSPRNARRFLSIVQPDLAIFVKYEFWYYYLITLEKNAVPVLMTSAIFRKNQVFFHWSGRSYLPALRAVTHYFVQDERSVALLRLIGIRNATVAGDTRFDRVMQNAHQVARMDIVERFVSGSKCMVLGSVWSSDRYVLEPFIRDHLGQLKFIIVPHTITGEELTLWETLGKSVRYSEVGRRDVADCDVLLIDNIGMLVMLYGYGDYAYVGGGFRGALHNLLEAAAFGIPVFFGAHRSNEKFLEAGGLEDCGAGFSFEDPEELEVLFGELWADSLRYAEAAEAARDYVAAHCGGTEKIMERIRMIL